MRTGRVVKASNNDFCKMVNVPKEVVEFFEKLRDEYNNDNFIVTVDPETFEDGTEASIEFMVYDYYVE